MINSNYKKIIPLNSTLKTAIKDLFMFKYLTTLKILVTFLANFSLISITYVLSLLLNALAENNRDNIFLTAIVLSCITAAEVLIILANKFLTNSLIKKLNNHFSEKIIAYSTTNNNYSWNKISNPEKIAFINQNVAQMVEMYHMTIFRMLGSVVSIISSIVAVLLLFPISLAYVVPFILLLIAGQFLVSVPYSKYGQLLQEINQKQSYSILTTFGNYLMIQRNNLKNPYKEFYKADQDKIYQKEWKAAKIVSIVILINVGFSGLFSGLTALATVFISINNGNVPFGSIIGTITISLATFGIAVATVNNIGLIMSGKSILAQIASLVWYKEFKETKIDSFEKIDIETKYKNTEQTKFIFKKGQKILIEGPNGSGKSTFLEFISGNFFINNIILKIDELDLSNENTFNMSQLTYLCTNENYFEDSILRENLLFSQKNEKNNLNTNKEKNNLMNNLLKLFKLEHLKIKEQINEKTMNFSEGEKQRVQIIRALLSNKKILIFDEALTNIDVETRNIIYDYLFNIEQRTVIFVSHDFDKRKYEKYIDQVLNTQYFKFFEREVKNV